MKTMNLNFRNILGATAIASMLFIGASTLTSCGKEGCTDINADNYNADATDDDGTCAYATDQFVGSYLVNEVCQPGTVTTNNISFSVAQSADKLTVTVTNFGNFGASFTMTGTVSGNTITLDTPESVTIGGDVYTVKAPATITLSGTNAVTIAYNFDYDDGTGAVNFTCTATGTKQ